MRPCRSSQGARASRPSGGSPHRPPLRASNRCTQAEAMKCARRDRVGRVVRQVPAGDPMDRRVEMRAGVLAAGKVVPVPGGTARVVARDLLDAERRACAEFRRQHDGRKLRRERLGEIDHADAPARRGRRRRCASDRAEAHALHPAQVRARAPWDCRASARPIPWRRRPDRRPRAARAAHRRSVGGERRGRKLRRRHARVPFVVDRPGEDVDDADAACLQIGAQAWANDKAAAFEAENVPCGGIIRERDGSRKYSPRRWRSPGRRRRAP